MKALRDPACSLCELHENAKTVCLPGDGPLTNARGIIIGQAPGRTEDREGFPFIGTSGRILDDALHDAGLDRRDFYVTNTCKCYPPEDRKPSVKEVKACSVYLQDELQKSHAPVVLLLGAVALQGIAGTGKKGIKAVRGVPFQKDGKTYLPTFHPAYIARSPSAMPQLQADIAQFKSLVTTGKVEDSSVPYRIVTGQGALEQLIPKLEGVVSFDLEATCLYPWDPKAKVVSVGLGTRKSNYIIPINYPRDYEEHDWVFPHQIHKAAVMRQLISHLNTYCDTVAHFGKFDQIWCEIHFDAHLNLSDDLGLMHYHLDENTPHDLEYVAQTLYAAPAYDVPLTVKTGETGTLKEHAAYLAKDVSYTRRAYFDVKKKLDHQYSSKRIYTYLTKPINDVYLKMQKRGIFIDTPRMAEVERHLKREIFKYKLRLRKVSKIKWTSQQQVAHYFYVRHKLPITDFTPKGDKPSAKESALLQITHPKHRNTADLVLKLRSAVKMYGTYIKGWKPFIVESRLHPSFKIHGTVTGRPSCADPNIQQTDRDTLIRSLVSAPPGWTLVESDLSQAELRITAHLSRDKKMLSVYAQDGDIHTFTAADVLGISMSEVTKDQRFIAKSLNFGLIYGMYEKKLMIYARDNYGVHLTLAEAKMFRKKFFELYAGLQPWHRLQINRARTDGYVRNLAGRIRHLPDAQLPYDCEERSEAERQAINSVVQSFVNELLMSALLTASARFSPEVFQPVATIHDSILAEVRNDFIPAYVPEMNDIMVKPPILEDFRIKLNVPMKSDFKLGPWGKGVSLEEWKEKIAA